MQKQIFADTGFVLHKVMLHGCKHSAWYDKNGNLIDCELIDKLGRSRPVSREAEQQLAALGRIHAFIPERKVVL